MRRKWLAIVAGSFMVSACGNSGNSSGPAVIPTPLPALTASHTRDVPLAQYVLSAQDAATFHNALIIKAVPCAKRFGVTQTMRPTNVAMSSDAGLLDNRYGVVEVQTARMYGYTKGEPASIVKVDNVSKGEWNPTAREAEVLTGNDAHGQKSQLTDSSGAKLHDGGCLGEALQGLEGEKNYRTDLIHLVSDGLNDAMNRMKSDPRLATTESAWVKCMDAKGYKFTHRDDAAKSVEGKSADGQRKTAVDDVTCAKSSSYLDTEYALDVAYQNMFIKQHAGEFKTAMDGVSKALASAREIVANGS